MKRYTFLLFVVIIVTCVWVADSFACSVCFGDPKSSMVSGAKAGVAVLLGILTVIIGAILGMAFYWIRRARLLEVQAALRGENIKL